MFCRQTRGDTVTALETAVDRQTERIGGRIRALRRARAFTLVQLAQRADLSHSFLSQLERGRARPSMVSLEKIARALGTSQLELIAAAEDELAGAPEAGTSVVRAGEGARGHYANGEGRMLVHGTRRFNPMEFTGTNADAGDFFVHEEDEFIHVMDGIVEVDLGSGQISVLTQGDSFYYVGGTPHRWRAVEPAGYRLFVVKEKPHKL